MDVKRGILATIGAVLLSVSWLIICYIFGYQGSSADFGIILAIMTAVSGVVCYYLLDRK